MVSDENLTSLLRQTRTKFEDVAKGDIKDVLRNYKDLTPKAQLHVFPDGTRRTALCLAGTLPITFKGARYHIPIALFLMDNHPYAPPFCYVCPTSNMKIRTSEQVDDKGRIFLPYLNEWQYPKYDTIGLLQVLTFAFEEKCPVFSVKNPRQTSDPNPSSRNSSSYSTGNTTPYPAGNTAPYPTSASNTPYPVGQTNFPMPVANPAPYPSFPMPNAGSADGYRAPYSAYPSAMMPSSTSYFPNIPAPPRHAYAAQVRDSLLTAIEERIMQKMRTRFGKMLEDTQRLDICLSDMRLGQRQLREHLERAEREQRELDVTLSVYNARKRDLTEIISKYTGKDAVNDVDSSIDAATPLHRQIFDNYAKDLAADDLIYQLTTAMRKKVITLQQYLTMIRQCARKKFFAVATMNKARDVAGLPMITQ
uniref:Tumor susceptibility protein 101 n=1 Tax=Panagrolaimus sp. JU765 TaxID=591449 RepID=A0AC34QUK3_9BILA